MVRLPPSPPFFSSWRQGKPGRRPPARSQDLPLAQIMGAKGGRYGWHDMVYFVSRCQSVSFRPEVSEMSLPRSRAVVVRQWQAILSRTISRPFSCIDGFCVCVCQLANDLRNAVQLHYDDAVGNRGPGICAPVCRQKIYPTNPMPGFGFAPFISAPIVSGSHIKSVGSRVSINTISGTQLIADSKCRATLPCQTRGIYPLLPRRIGRS